MVYCAIPDIEVALRFETLCPRIGFNEFELFREEEIDCESVRKKTLLNSCNVYCIQYLSFVKEIRLLHKLMKFKGLICGHSPSVQNKKAYYNMLIN